MLNTGSIASSQAHDVRASLTSRGSASTGQASRRSDEDEFTRVVSGESDPPVDVTDAAELAAWCLTGMSGWWSLNIIIAELPIFIHQLSEGKRLGNLLAVCTQLGNLAPILYKGLTRRRPGNLVYVISFFQAVAACSLLACAAFWQYLPALLLCTGLSGSVGCMSAVTYWAAVSRRPPSCLRAMSVGMVLGGLLASGFSQLQLAGREQGNPRFSPVEFFLIAALVQVVMGAVFMWRSRAGGGAAGVEATTARAAVPAKAPTPPAARFLMAGCFSVYAATYTMPSLQPFMAGGYESGTEQQQLMLWMLTLQNLGDVLGRLSTVLVSGNRLVLIAWSALLTVSYLAACFAAAEHDQVAEMFRYGLGLLLLPAVNGIYYFSRGLLVTTFYLFAQKLGEKETVQDITTNMGFCGQMGALSANAVAFVVVRLCPG